MAISKRDRQRREGLERARAASAEIQAEQRARGYANGAWPLVIDGKRFEGVRAAARELKQALHWVVRHAEFIKTRAPASNRGRRSRRACSSASPSPGL